MFLIHIPRAKQRGEIFRDSFKTFAMSLELCKRSIDDASGARRRYRLGSRELEIPRQQSLVIVSGLRKG